MYEVKGLVCHLRGEKKENAIVRVDTYQRAVIVLDEHTEQEFASLEWADIETAHPYGDGLKVIYKKGCVMLYAHNKDKNADEMDDFEFNSDLSELGIVLRSVITRHEPKFNIFQHIFKQLSPYTDCSDMDVHMRAICAARELADAPVPARTLVVPRHGSGELLADMRSNGTLSDVTVVLDARDGEAVVRLPAHRLVLAAHSPVFRAMFTGEMQEANSGEVPLDMRPSVGRAIVDICYTGRAVVTEDIGIDLLTAADMLGMEQLSGVVAEWLLPAIRPSNVFPMWMAATRVRQTRLVDKCSNLAFYFLGFCWDARAPLLAHLRECTADQLTDILSAAARERYSTTRIRTVIDAWAAQQTGREDAVREMLALLVEKEEFETRDQLAILCDLRDWPTVEGAIKCCQELLQLLDNSNEGDSKEGEEEKMVARATALSNMADNHLHVVLRKLMQHKDATLDALSLRLLAALVAGRWIRVKYVQKLDEFLCTCLASSSERLEAAVCLLASLFSLPCRPVFSDELSKALITLLTSADPSDEPRLALLCDALEAVGGKMSCAVAVPLFSHHSTRVRLLMCRFSPSFSRFERRQNCCAIVSGLCSLLSDPSLRAQATRALYKLAYTGDGTWPSDVFLDGDMCAFSHLTDVLGSIVRDDDPPLDSKDTVKWICKMLANLLNDTDVAYPLINNIFLERHALTHIFVLCSKEWVRGASAEEESLPCTVLSVVCGVLDIGESSGEKAAHLLTVSEHAVPLMLSVLCHDHRISGILSHLARSIVDHLLCLIHHKEHGKIVRELMSGSESRVLDEMARRDEMDDCGYTEDLLEKCKLLVDVLHSEEGGSRKRKA